MILVNRKYWRLELKIKPKAEQFFWKPNYCGMVGSFHKHENGTKFNYINCWAIQMSEQIWITWLFWSMRLYLIPKINTRLGNPEVFVRYYSEDIHIMYGDHGSWDDPKKYDRRDE